MNDWIGSIAVNLIDHFPTSIMQDQQPASANQSPVDLGQRSPLVFKMGEAVMTDGEIKAPFREWQGMDICFNQKIVVLSFFGSLQHGVSQIDGDQPGLLGIFQDKGRQRPCPGSQLQN